MDQQDSLQSQMFHYNFTASNDKEKAQPFDLPHLPIILNRNIQA